ncbi:MAG: polysaccharide deacetylase family protein [Clostridia bacterium]|nr:polysaccharide deacetylase family protein [Clostridia bacterium]
MKRLLTMLLLVVLCLALTSCQQLETLREEAVLPKYTATPEPALTCEPAQLYTGVDTEERLVSLVLEGYTDDTTITQLIDLMKARDIPCVWFVSGVTADEHVYMLRHAAASGIELGNYTISAEKELENRSASYLVHQFQRTQQLILAACAQLPSIGRCNTTQYTDTMLQAVRAGGLTHAVEPTLYLNHRSFASESDAQLYMESLVRGSIISVKLGQELDDDEYGDLGEELDERPAIDPPPTISEDLTKEDTTYQNIVSVVTWLLDQLEQGGYEVVSLDELQAARADYLPQVKELTEEELALYDPTAYAAPVAQAPIGQCATRAGTTEELDGAVFVGDAITNGLGGYVAWRNQQADFLPNTRFITWPGMTVEGALNTMEPGAILTAGQVNIAQAIKESGAARVYLMLKPESPRGYVLEEYLTNLRLLIHLIQQENPGVQVIVQSVLPGVSQRTTAPTNANIFRYNLLLGKMCQEHGIPFLDVAFALRDTDGGLKTDYCIDADTYGIHLSDAGCQAWLDYLVAHIPE